MKKITFLSVLSALLPAITVIVNLKKQKEHITAQDIITALIPAIEQIADETDTQKN